MIPWSSDSPTRTSHYIGGILQGTRRDIILEISCCRDNTCSGRISGYIPIDIQKKNQQGTVSHVKINAPLKLGGDQNTCKLIWNTSGINLGENTSWINLGEKFSGEKCTEPLPLVGTKGTGHLRLQFDWVGTCDEVQTKILHTIIFSCNNIRQT